MRKLVKKFLSTFLAVLMICTMVGGYFISDVVYANGADVIPTDVVFEDLEQTMNMYSIAVTKGYNNLGQLEDQSHGFQFIVTRPGAEDEGKVCKIGLYNTSERNPWGDGYILALSGGNADGELSWSVLRGNGEGLLASGKLTGVEDEVMVSVWLSDINAETGAHTLNVIMDGSKIVARVDDGTTLLGKWLAAYNDMDTVLTMKTTKEIDVNPQDVVFEDLGQTMNMNSIAVTKGSNNLGKLEDQSHGFQFIVTRPGEEDPNVPCKIGLYNPSEENPWSGGYILVLKGGNADGELSWEVRRSNEVLLASGKLTGVEDEVMVSVWLSDINAETGAHTLNIIMDGRVIVVHEDDGTTQLGNWLAAYNDMETVLTIKTIKEMDVIPKDVVFEDLEQTMNMYSIAVTKGSNNLGQLEDQSHGFQFIVTRPGAEDEGKVCKIGLYNTSERNPWGDGYILALSGGNADGELSWAVLRGNGEGLLASGKLTGVEDEVMVSVWLSDINAETGAHTLNVVMDGSEIVARVDDGTTQLGNWLAAYNDMDTVLTIKTIKEIDVNPQDVVFEDLGQTMNMNSIAVTKGSNNLGQLEDQSHGFQFIVTRPGEEDQNVPCKIGLYNTSEENPWSGGYILVLKGGNADGELSWEVRRSNEVLLASGKLTGVEDEVMVSVWLSDINAETGAHTLNIIMDGRVIVVHEDDGTTQLGNWLAAYNDMDTVLTMKTIKEIDVNPTDVKYQIKEVGGVTQVRLVTYVDSLDYQNVSLNITYNGVTKSIVCDTAYTAIYADGELIENPAAVFENDAAYFITAVLAAVPADVEFEVSVTWTDLEGNQTTSEARTITISAN